MTPCIFQQAKKKELAEAKRAAETFCTPMDDFEVNNLRTMMKVRSM